MEGYLTNFLKKKFCGCLILLVVLSIVKKNMSYKYKTYKETNKELMGI